MSKIGVKFFKSQVLIRPISLFSSLAYSGDTCSEDKNGCAEVECFSGVECCDIPAPGVGAECGPCATGFTGDGLKCFGNDTRNMYHNIKPNSSQILMSVPQTTPCVTRFVRTPWGAMHAVVKLDTDSMVKFVKVSLYFRFNLSFNCYNRY